MDNYLNPEKSAKIKYNQIGKFLEGTPLKPEEFLGLIDGVNNMNPLEVYARLNVLDEFFAKFPKPPKEPLQVFYGFRKLTKKIVRKPSIIIIFENGITRTSRKSINQKMKVIYQRLQTDQELEDSKHSNRMFTQYEYLINEKVWKRDLQAILNDNFYADENHVSEDERNHIRELLRSQVLQFYGNQIHHQFQSTIKF